MQQDAYENILTFWFDDIDHSRWFRADPVFDRELAARFGNCLEDARADRLDHWCTSGRGRLALIIVLDQFSRNIHRGTAGAFAADDKALRLALDGMRSGADLSLSPEQRAFFYLPLRHAEDLAMQELGLARTRELNALGYGSDKYALSHLDIVRRFGRFPQRNAALGRADTAEEAEYLGRGKAGFDRSS